MRFDRRAQASVMVTLMADGTGKIYAMISPEDGMVVDGGGKS